MDSTIPSLIVPLFFESILYTILLLMEKNQQLTMKDFQIMKELGSGSYGRVQLVKRKSDQRLYALKSMFLANAKQKEKDAALNQIRLLASIDMPNVISYKCSFYVQELQSLCIVMEYADGGDLQCKINDRSDKGESGFDQRFIWKTAYQLLKGLKGLHQHNIIHRDMKSANIFYVGGVAKIGDLNISKITDNGFATTQTGTPYYTSPQIWKGVKYDNKCDIWALGCIVYEMCMLIPPFRAQDFPGLFQTVTNGKYQDIPTKYTKSMRQFIAQCLKVEPSSRPSASNLLEKPYFAEFQLSVECITAELEDQNKIKILEPIECPKVLRFLNEKLPKSKFDGQSKRTVAFLDREQETTASFKIKTKKIRSEKTIIIDNDDGWKEEKQQRRVPKFISNKSNVKLPPLEAEANAPKSSKLLPLKQETRSMKNIMPEKQGRRLMVR